MNSNWMILNGIEWNWKLLISGGFKGGLGATTPTPWPLAPGPALLVTQKGPRTWEKFEKKSQENIWIHPCGIKILRKKTWRIILVNKNFQTRAPQVISAPGPAVPKTATAVNWNWNWDGYPISQERSAKVFQIMTTGTHGTVTCSSSAMIQTHTISLVSQPWYLIHTRTNASTLANSHVLLWKIKSRTPVKVQRYIFNQFFE